MTNTDTPQPGWYPNPGGQGTRYFDGAAWTNQTLPPGIRPQANKKAHGHRPFTWVILAVQVVFVAWLVYGFAQAGKAVNNCDAQTYVQACKDGAGLGTALGVGLVLFLWVMVDIILGVIWLVTKRDK